MTTYSVKDTFSNQTLGSIVETETAQGLQFAAYGKRDNYLGTWANLADANAAVEMDPKR